MRSVWIHIDDAKGSGTRQSFLLRLDGHAPARLKMQEPSRTLEINVARRGDPNVLAFEVTRRVHEKDGRDQAMKLDATVRLHPGGRATIGRVSRLDGSTTDVKVEAQ